MSISQVERLKQKSSSNRRVHQPQIAKPIRPGQQATAVMRPISGTSASSSHGSVDGSYDASRQQGSIVVRAASPSKIPIVPLNSAQPPIIKGMGYRDNEMSIGGSGVSQRVKNAVGTEHLGRQRIRKPGYVSQNLHLSIMLKNVLYFCYCHLTMHVTKQ